MIKDKIVLGSFIFSGSMILLSSLVALLSLPVDAGYIIIRFDNYHNEVVWADSLLVFVGVVLVALSLIALNLFLVKHIYSKERFLAYVLSVGTAVVSLFFLAGTIAITLIN